MPEPLYVLVNFIIMFIDVLSIAMLIRAIMGWFFATEGGLYHFLYVLTEPVIIPLRKLFVAMNWFQESPIDVAFGLSYITLFVVQTVMSSFLA